jgi:hypothetical protein
MTPNIDTLTDLLIDVAASWTEEPYMRALGDERERTRAVLNQVRVCVTLHILQTILDEADDEPSPIFDAMRLAAQWLAEHCVGAHGCSDCFHGEAKTRFAVRGAMDSAQ